MSYNPGALVVFNPSDCKSREKYGFCECPGVEHDPPPSDATRYFPGQQVAFLPHSCDQWIIGGPKEVQALITDLKVALANMLLGEGSRSDARYSERRDSAEEMPLGVPRG